MKKQLFELLRSKLNKFKIIYLIPAFAGILLFESCENDIEKVKSFDQVKDIYSLTSENVKIIHTDSARLKYIVESPFIRRSEDGESPFTEFPDGVKISHFDKNEELESVITANYAIHYEKEQYWEARDDVEARNVENQEQLNTEQIFWFEKSGLINSSKFTRIINPDGTFYGEGGFEADQSFTWWKLKNVKESSVNYDDE